MAKKAAKTATATKAAAAAPKAAVTYEAMFLMGPGAATDADGAIATCRGIIERHEGQILVIKRWDERKLAYEMRGNKRGTYIIAYFTAPGTAVSAIERDVNLSEDVLRVIVLKADHLNKEEMEKVEPQPIVPREERERAPWDRPSWESGPGGDRGPRDDRGPRRRRDEEAEVGAENE